MEFGKTKYATGKRGGRAAFKARHYLTLGTCGVNHGYLPTRRITGQVPSLYIQKATRLTVQGQDQLLKTEIGVPNAPVLSRDFATCSISTVRTNRGGGIIASYEDDASAKRKYHNT